jgi:DNA gyrase subunit A
VATCLETDDVLLTTHDGQCIRFPVTDVRVFAGRNSVGVRGISLADGDSVISMSILGHFEAAPEERAAYMKMRRAIAGEEADIAPADGEELGADAPALTPERYAAMSAAEQYVLTVSANGYGKRTSAFEYRITGRGGKGIVAMAVNERNGPIVASFPVEHDDQIMLVTAGGQIIRCGVDEIRVAGRSTQGVIVFKGDGEKVVSVERLEESGESAEGEVGEGPGFP